MERSDLQQLSKEELIELVLRLQRPGKTSKTSSLPPSQDKKERRENSRPGGAKPGHKGHWRAMCEEPDAVIDHVAERCPDCGASLGAAGQVLSGEYERIELPAMRPYVERHRRFACRCWGCGLRVDADLPKGIGGTPFGPRLHGLAIYLKTFQALSYERLRGLFGDVFGLSISEGALMNMFRRSHKAFAGEADKARAQLRGAECVASDETGVRIEGTNAQHWVFRCSAAVVHQPDYSRAAHVVDRVMEGHRPTVWLSDRYSAQQNHGEHHQTCLAHLARDVAFAHEHGTDRLPMRLKLWFDKVFAFARDITSFAASTIAARHKALERELDAILTTPTRCELAAQVQRKIARARDQLLTFCTFPGKVEATNNGCEQALRPAVIQRKVTNGYRAMWAAQAEADVRTTVDTARIAGKKTFQTIMQTIAQTA
jgi:transposase